MNPYALIDLHCDTLTDCTYSNPDTTIANCTHKGPTADTLDDPGRVLSLSSLPSDVHWAQFYAIFIPDQHPVDRLPSITTKQTVTILTARWKNFMTASPPAVPFPICMLHGRQERRPLF